MTQVLRGKVQVRVSEPSLHRHHSQPAPLPRPHSVPHFVQPLGGLPSPWSPRPGCRNLPGLHSCFPHPKGAWLNDQGRVEEARSRWRNGPSEVGVEAAFPPPSKAACSTGSGAGAQGERGSLLVQIPKLSFSNSVIISPLCSPVSSSAEWGQQLFLLDHLSQGRRPYMYQMQEVIHVSNADTQCALNKWTYHY